MGAKPPPKSPRFGADPNTVEGDLPAWDITSMDLEGEWAWRRIKATDLRHIQERVRELSRLTWREISAQKSCGYMDSDAMCAAAQKRFRELKKEEWADRLYKLRVHGKVRIWGIRSGSEFKVLWWDPDHTVYPMNPKNN